MAPEPPRTSSPESLSDLHARVRELEQEVVRRRSEAAAMAAAARLAGEFLPVEELAARVAETIVELFGAASACIRRLDPDGGLVALAWAGTPSAPAFPRGHVLPRGMATGARAVALGRAVWTSDVLADPDIILSPELRRLTGATQDRAVLAVPLKARG